MTDKERKISRATPSAGEDRRDEQLRALFAVADPATEPSAALQQRVVELVAHHGDRSVRLGTVPRAARRPWTPWRIGLGLAGAAALALVAVGMAPIWVAAQVLHRAEAAVAKVQNAHVITWRVAPDGSRTKISEQWEQGRRWRIWDLVGQRMSLLTGGKLWVYQPKLNKVTVRTFVPSALSSSGYTLTQMLHDYTGHGWSNQIRAIGDATVGGQRAHQVVVQRAGWRERALVRVDAATDLLLQMEMQQEADGRWTTLNVMEIQYNEALPANLFAANFPKSAQVSDLDHAQQEWSRRLARVIARRRVGDRTIAIRDLQVNAEGDLFMLYTAGKHPGDNFKCDNPMAGRDWKIEVKDDFGTAYIWQTDNFARSEGMPKQYARSYVFNGERLEGDWWIPAVPQSPWKPRRFTVTFRVNPVNLHGRYEDPEQQAVYTDSAVFTLPVAAPSSLLVPDYMAEMARGLGLEDGTVVSRHATARAWYYRYELSDLPRALEYYRQAIRLGEERARETGQPFHDSETWRNIGTLLRQMGRKEEARAALEEAVRGAIYADGNRQNAEEALEALKRDLAWSVGRPAPSFTGTDLNGRPQSPQRYRGQVLVIHLWGTWDENARADLPTVQALHDRYSGKGLAVLGIGVDVDAPGFRNFVKEHAIPWPRVYERGGSPELLGLLDSYGSPAAPRTILIDRQGIIRALDLHGPALQKAVSELLARA